MSDYRCPQHAEGMPDAHLYYTCDSCRLGDVLEPGDTDKYGNQYQKHDEWVDAA